MDIVETKLYYYDPENKEVIKEVEFSKKGIPIPLENTTRENKRRKKYYYPWGTGKSLIKHYNINGKEEQVYVSLDSILEVVQQKPYF
jgi:hypothetical protein